MNRRHLFAALAMAAAPRFARAQSEKDLGIDEAKERMAALAKELDLAFPFRAPSVLIEKAARKLTLSDGKTLVKRYSVSLGLVPDGHKEQQGDYRTPEGDYYVCYRNYGSAFHLFLGLSYPNGADAAKALEKGLIDSKTAERIKAAEKKRERPSWDSALGGAVGIHGGGVGSDWTWGCIALENPEMDELWAALPMGTPVKVVR